MKVVTQIAREDTINMGISMQTYVSLCYNINRQIGNKYNLKLSKTGKSKEAVSHGTKQATYMKLVEDVHSSLLSNACEQCEHKALD